MVRNRFSFYPDEHDEPEAGIPHSAHNSMGKLTPTDRICAINLNDKTRTYLT